MAIVIVEQPSKNGARRGYIWKDTHMQASHQIDGQYQERYENIWSRRPNDGKQEGMANDGDNGRHTLVYKSQGENCETNS